MKKCYKCKSVLPRSQFSKLSRSPDGLEGKCRECRKIERKPRLEKHRADQYQRTYRISLDEKARMSLDQDSRCKICDRECENLHTDHDHQTGRIRGLLCPTCNKGLGLFQDSPDYMHSAQNYLMAGVDVLSLAETL